MTWMASSLYGGLPSTQPTASGVPDHPPGTPEPMARTQPRPSGRLKSDPTMALVGLLGLAILLIKLGARA